MNRPPQLLLALVALAMAPAAAQHRLMQPEDLFRVRQVGAVAWSPDGLYAAIELSNPGRTLDTSVPSNELALLDVRARKLRTLRGVEAGEVGLFNAVWSPDGRRLAFLSVDASAVVRPWIWTAATNTTAVLPDLDIQISFGDPPLVWLTSDRIAVLAWEPGVEKSGLLYFRLLRGRNAADQWKTAFDGKVAAVSVLESGQAPAPAAPSVRLIAVDLAGKGRSTLAQGSIHNLTLSGDGRFLRFLREVPGQKVASFFESAGDPEKMYDAVNWGTEPHAIDAQSGQEVAPESLPLPPPKPAPKAVLDIPPPGTGARRLSASPAGDAVLWVANGADGTHLWLGGGGQPHTEVWSANQWVAEIRTGKAEQIAYTGPGGDALTGWVLLPPGYTPGARLPVIAVVYPGSVYGASVPSSFSPLRTDFEHPQLLAALGYAVLLPSMPAPKDPALSHSLEWLPSAVLPAVDALVARGIADPDRVAVLGQSDGGFAALGLVTQTDRFRSAIASASFSNLASLYGTFYGQFRHGDAGPPQKGQALRMLQMEKGVFALGGPPWEQPGRYRAGSAVAQAGQVRTPVMLIHGTFDFIPIQQAEEFFTALYRQDKRAAFVRYEGEWHTITARANVLDLWKRIGAWLAETMRPRP